MAITNNTHIIRDLYGQTPSYGNTAGSQSPVPIAPSSMPEDRVTFSNEALSKNRINDHAHGTDAKDQELSAEEKQVVNNLRKRDTEVKAHEAAHMAAGGGIVQGGASYEYQSGPDGKMYAVGGEVQIDMSPAGTPEATIQKMQQVRAAALAPAQPSGTDRAVAAQAAQVEAQARMEKTQKNQDEKEDQAQHNVASATNAERYTPPGALIDFMA